MEKHKVFLSDKGTNINKIRHVDKDKAISDDKQLCKTLSNFLQEVMKTPGVSEPFHTSSYSQSDPVNDAMRKYEKYSSVLKISETNYCTNFLFVRIDKADAENAADTLNSSKVGIFKNNPTKCLKVTSDICTSLKM